MTTALLIGHPDRHVQASDVLVALHAREAFTGLLHAQGSNLGALIAQGGHPLHHLPSQGWGGEWAIRQGERPPCYGIDRLRAILADAAVLQPAPRVVICGPFLGFGDRRRVRAWDVPVGLVVDEVLRVVLDGWVVEPGGVLVRLRG